MSKSKKGKKKHGKKSKADKAKLKSPSKKQANKEARKAKKVRDAALRVVNQPPVDFSTVVINEAYRRSICNELGFSPRETSYVTKAVMSILRFIVVLKRDPIATNDHPLIAGRLGEGEQWAVDLATLISVANTPSYQEDIRLALKRSAFIGPTAVRLLQRFVQKAQEVALVDAQAAKAG